MDFFIVTTNYLMHISSIPVYMLNFSNSVNIPPLLLPQYFQKGNTRKVVETSFQQIK